MFSRIEERDTEIHYSETPLIQILGGQLNLFELEGFPIKGYYI